MTKLEFIRRTRKMTQAETAALLGVSPTIISHIENRRREAYPKIRKALSELYGVPETELFDAHGLPVDVQMK